MMNDRAIVVPAQPGLWLVMLSRGLVAGEPWELTEQPLIAWDLSSVVYDIGAVPIGVLAKAWPDDQWAKATRRARAQGRSVMNPRGFKRRI